MITLVHGGESYLVDRAARDLLQPVRSGLTLDRANGVVAAVQCCCELLMDYCGVVTGHDVHIVSMTAEH